MPQPRRNPRVRTIDDLSLDELRSRLRRLCDVRSEINNWGDRLSVDEIVAMLDTCLRDQADGG